MAGRDADDVWAEGGWAGRPGIPLPPISPYASDPAPKPVPLPPLEIRTDPPTRRSLVWETRWVVLAFVVPAVIAAIIPLVQHAEGVSDVNRFPTLVPGQPLTNMVLGILSYLGVGAVVPIALFLLTRTGQTPSQLGLGWPSWRLDIWPGLGLIALSFVSEIAVLIPLSPLLAHHSGLVTHPAIGHIPRYYVVYGLAVSAITAITEEVLINGYLLVRLEQLGWLPNRALLLSLALRTSYHAYYGLGIVLTIPFGYFVTRSFQKHRRLNRPIVAHFLFDAVLFTISVLTA